MSGIITQTSLLNCHDLLRLALSPAAVPRTSLAGVGLEKREFNQIITRRAMMRISESVRFGEA